MISVFGAFILTPDVEIKMFAVGLTVAVFLDATIVRMVLVPSSMALMGDANWWLPEWLDRLLPDVDVEGSAVLGASDDTSALDHHRPVGVPAVGGSAPTDEASDHDPDHDHDHGKELVHS
jgi:RND superfamily putative drug exporter